MINLRYPKITRDIMVNTGFCDALLDIPDPPPYDLLRTLLRTTGYLPGISWVIPVYLVISKICTLSFACIFKFMSLYMHKK